MSAEAVVRAAMKAWTARKARCEAKKQFAEWCREHIDGGSDCEYADYETSICYQRSYHDRDDWCGICKARQVEWEKYRAAAKASSAARSALTSACARYAKETDIPAQPAKGEAQC